MIIRKAIPSLLAAVFCSLAIPARAGTTYYFAANGNDASDCKTLSAPCRTLERLNALPQLPGTVFLLRRGDRFPGAILAQGSGFPREPLTFSAYGDGPAPILDGGLPVTVWILVAQGPAAWTYAADVPPETDGQPFALIEDDRVLPLARFPDSGFARVASADSESLVLDPASLARHPHGLPGSNLRIRAQRHILSNRAVSGYDSTTGRITWDGPLPKDPLPGSGVFFTDTPDGLDRPGAWYCYPEGTPLPRDGHRLRLTLAPGDAPAAHSLRIANAGYGIKGSGVANLRVAGIDFEAQVSAAVYCYDCTQVDVENCHIRNAVLTGIDFSGTGLTATGNSIEGALLAGISSLPPSDLNPLQTVETGARIVGNRIARIGLFARLGRSGPEDDGETGIGIRALGNGDRIDGNRIDSTACDGIRFLGRRDIVDGNLVRNACLHLDDAGAIHAGPAQGAWGSEGSEVRRNGIVAAPGSAAGTSGASTQAYGIFLDERTADIKVAGNFVTGADLGVCIRRGRGHFLTGNVLYANRLAPVRDGLAPGRSGEAAANLYQGNVLWAVWAKGQGFLPGLPAAPACIAGPQSKPCPPANPTNLACAESESSAACDGDINARYPGAVAAQLAIRFRDFARKLGAGDSDPATEIPAFKAILPLLRPGEGP